MVFFPNMDSSPKRFPIEQNMLRHFDVNLVTNGGFDTDSGWSKNSGWTISGGTANSDGTASGSDIYQNVGIVAGKTYSISIDVKSITSGSVNLLWYNGSSFPTIKSALPLGESTYTFTPTSGTNGYIYINSTNFVGSIDNVKVQEYGTSGFVTTLYDQTGNNCHALQSTAAYQPQIVSSGALIKSGNHPAWEFIGGNPQRSLVFNGLTGIAHLDAFFVQDSSDNTYIYPSSGNGSYFGIIATQNSTSTDVVRSPYGTPTLEVNGTAPSISNTGGNWSALNGRKLAYHRSASTASWPEVNLGNTFGVNTEWNLGAQVSGGGGIKFSEMIWYDSDQHSNQSGIESNINSHYSIY